MPRSTQKTVVLICSFLSCCAAIILASVSLSTKYWITQDYYVHNQTMYTGKQIILNAGLFVVEFVNPVIGGNNPHKMKDMYTNDNCPDFMNFGTWISTILFISLGMVFGVVAAVFAAVNSAITPIEEITGLTGLYLWNGLACLFSLISILLWVGLYCNYFVDILWSLKCVELQLGPLVPTHEPSYLGYSFYLMCGVAFLYLLNNGLVYLASRNFDKNKSVVKDMEEVTEGGLIMLY